MTSQTHHPDGRRTIGLFIPYEAKGKRIEAVTFDPCTFGHLLRWQSGMIPGSIALMIELTGLELSTIEGIRHPDDARVMAAFLDHIHPEIAADVRNGVRPAGSPSPLDLGTPAPPAAAQGLGEGPEGHGASDPFGGYDEFEQVPPGRPSDYVEGLDD